MEKESYKNAYFRYIVMEIITNEMVQAYISEIKIIPDDFKIKFKYKKCGHIQSDNTIIGKNKRALAILVIYPPIVFDISSTSA